MLSYKFAKKYFKQLYILREILEWPGELFWELCDENGILLVYEQFEVDKDIFYEFKVQGLPTVIKLKDGKETGRLFGLQPVNKLTELISNNYDSLAYSFDSEERFLSSYRKLVGKGGKYG